MSELVADCPRCDSQRITFDLTQDHYVRTEYDWQHWYEVFCICRHCRRATIFVLSLKTSAHDQHQIIKEKGLVDVGRAINRWMDIKGFIKISDFANASPPEHLPMNIRAAFEEAAKCLAIDCYNATGTMFRLCIDIATRSLLPEGEVAGLNAKTRRDLGLRLPWLFDNAKLPENLRELSTCVKEDGNDGAHAGTLQKADAEDLFEFTMALLERIYTEPEKLRLAKERREKRRGNSAS